MTEERTEAASVAELAQQAHEPSELEAGKLYLVATSDGGVKQIDTLDYATTPLRKKGVNIVANFESFQQYLDKHGRSGETEVTANVTQSIFTAIVNAGDDEHPGWADHSVTLRLTKSPEWQRWAALSGKLISQTEFAEFIEDNAKDIFDPSSGEILEIAQSLQVKRGVEFESGTRLSDGNVQFGYRETTTATAGAVGQLTIPEKITLGLRPFKGGEQYKVEALFRYRLYGKELSLGFKLQDPEKVIEDAFESVAREVGEYAAQRDFLYLIAG
ncbi:DUF2303 family protein [Paenarthrobacter sp. OM7]|uniref:DUF2303 family protein n=1 Tax=Paenarthrobacter sp. OM7 TaxID=3041264 RepID=UPI0024688694|nr:DUF2303 family protein [Paenarthrobacter sp. OM7]WGM21839.1 DUF2303 family protein [Paenarthrobacter sp. OM7]